jgi:hypothetical protein
MTVQGNHAKTRTTTQDEDFPPLPEKLSWTSLRPKASQLRKKKRLYIEETTPRQSSRSRTRSEIRRDRHMIPGASTLRLMPIASLCSVSMAFHRRTTGWCLGNFFMHTTLILYLYKTLRRIVWTTFPDMWRAINKSRLTSVKTQLYKSNKLTSNMFRPSRVPLQAGYLKHIRK